MIRYLDNLRFVFAIDCFTCVSAGLLMLLGANWLAPLLGLPASLLVWAGGALLPVAVLFGFMSLHTPTNRTLLLLAVAGNMLWVIGSVIVACVFSPTLLGFAFVVMQAGAVAVLALLEASGLRSPASAKA
jgi:hypothetical protein